MNRRSLLASTASLGALLAGCSGAGTGADDGDTTTTPTATPTPNAGTPTGHSFQVVDSYCRSDPGDATVQFGDGQVTVHGRIEAPNGCYTAELAGLDQKDGTLTVRVQTREKSGACVQCLYAIEYEATIEYDDSGPSTVVVWHDGSEVTRSGR